MNLNQIHKGILIAGLKDCTTILYMKKITISTCAAGSFVGSHGGGGEGLVTPTTWYGYSPYHFQVQLKVTRADKNPNVNGCF